MAEMLKLRIYDGNRLVTELALERPPRSGERVPVPLRQIDPLRSYTAVMVTPGAGTRRYAARIAEVANHRAILALRLLRS